MRGGLAVVIALISIAACAPKRVSAPPAPPPPAPPPARTVVVLLPDADTGLTGRAEVTNAHGTVALSAERDATVVVADRRPDDVRTLTEADVQQGFGEALAALPQPLRHFTLFFRFESDELTDESRAQLPEVIKAVGGRAAPDVAIIGHTDTAGDASANTQLGLKRAMAVRRLLVAAGLDPSMVEVTSHGEADPATPTPDDTAERRNRRVEISVR